MRLLWSILMSELMYLNCCCLPQPGVLYATSFIGPSNSYIWSLGTDPGGNPAWVQTGQNLQPFTFGVPNDPNFGQGPGHNNLWPMMGSALQNHLYVNASLSGPVARWPGVPPWQSAGMGNAQFFAPRCFCEHNGLIYCGGASTSSQNSPASKLWVSPTGGGGWTPVTIPPANVPGQKGATFNSIDVMWSEGEALWLGGNGIISSPGFDTSGVNPLVKVIKYLGGGEFDITPNVFRIKNLGPFEEDGWFGSIIPKAARLFGGATHIVGHAALSDFDPPTNAASLCKYEGDGWNVIVTDTLIFRHAYALAVYNGLLYIFEGEGVAANPFGNPGAMRTWNGIEIGSIPTPMDHPLCGEVHNGLLYVSGANNSNPSPSDTVCTFAFDGSNIIDVPQIGGPPPPGDPLLNGARELRVFNPQVVV